MTFRITQHSEIPANCVPLLEATVFGSDGLRYRRLNVAEQLQRFSQPEYFAALAGDELIGCYVVDRRELQIDNQKVSGYYRGALAIASSWQGKGAASQLIQRAMQWQAASAVSSISYGCIDLDNQRSLNILGKQGTVQTGLLSRVMLYRQWPRQRCDLVPLENTLQDNESSLRNHVYKDCVVKDVTPNAQPGIALLDDHGIAISARASLSAFNIISMSAAMSWSVRLFVSPWPPARKRFDPSCFRYVSLSNVLIRPGCESRWPAFVSTIMARHNVHFAALYLDTRAALFNRLRVSQPLGSLLHSSTGSIAIVARVNGGDALLAGRDGAWSVWPVDA